MTVILALAANLAEGQGALIAFSCTAEPPELRVVE
jgi:hypothetical protein